MSTKIQWTDETWNPIRGCSPVSPGCANCYASRQAMRMSEPFGAPYHGLVRDGRWTGAVRFDQKQLAKPLHWKKPRRIFVCSMSDLFHGGVPDEAISSVFGVMAAAAQHDFQVVTKRAPGMARWFADIGESRIGPVSECEHAAVDTGATLPYLARPWPLTNVWLGVSCEDQCRYDERVPVLLETPAALRWVSLEPLLGPIRIDNIDALQWVVVGGESGPRARACKVEWIEDVMEQCRVAGVPVFVKQLGSEWARKHGAKSRAGSDPAEWPEHLRVREMPR